MNARDRSFVRQLDRALAIEGWVKPDGLDWCFYGLRYETGGLADPVLGAIRMPLDHSQVWAPRREPLAKNPFPRSSFLRVV